jgi:hypothetical protein
MAWGARLVVDCRKTVRLHFIQRARVRLSVSVGLGAAAGLWPIRPQRMRIRVGTLRRPAKNPRAARSGGGDWSVPFASTRIWRAFGSPLSRRNLSV